MSSAANTANAASAPPLAEPAEPRVVTESIPGPASKRALDQLAQVQDTRAAQFVCDYAASVGNYIADVDGNMLLDMYCQIASIPVGYNNARVLAAARDPRMATALANRPALGVFPPGDWAELLQATLLSVRPAGLDMVFTTAHGSDANELAFKAALMWHADRQRAGRAFSAAEDASAMDNRPPGAPDTAILSFRAGFHGRTFGALSATRSKALFKMDIPAFRWPAAPFPQLQYPLAAHADANAREEQRCLDELDRILRESPVPVAAAIIEPIQSEGGDRHASPAFFRGVRRITQDHGVLLIVDEVQTGCGATGTFWAHEQWALPAPPDVVTFSKKMQAAGFYHTRALVPPQPFRNFNTWMGDVPRALVAGAIVDEVAARGLVAHVRETGAYLLARLEPLAARHPRLVAALRGAGTFVAFDCPSAETRAELLRRMRDAGVNVGGSGERTVRLRPMLTLAQPHVDVFVARLEAVLAAL